MNDSSRQEDLFSKELIEEILEMLVVAVLVVIRI
jgi:hypothetical protein